jgi:uncharacterized protein
VNVEMYFRPLSSYCFQADPDFWDSAFIFLRKVFIQGKFLNLLSFLLGFGIASQYSKRGHDRTFFYKRGLFFLLLGVVHGLIWPGDILTFYGITVLLLWRLGQASPRVIGALGLLCAIISCIMIFLSRIQIQVIPDPLLAQQYLAGLGMREFLAAKIYMYGLQQINALIYGWGILAASLFGMYAQKTRTLFRSPILLCFGLACSVLYAVTEFEVTNFALINSISYTVSSLIMPYLYIFLFRNIPKSKMTESIGHVGKSSLSNYLAQSLLLTLFGMGYTFQELVLIQRFHYLWIVTLFFLLQIALTTFWFRKYEAGPLEALFSKKVSVYKS